MESCREGIKRCQHIKTKGAQCGAPALRGKKFCFYHQESQAERVEVKGADGSSIQVVVPLFEDASSIQTMVRRVAILLLEDKIEGKKAGQLLYALQIASVNLREMEREKPRAEQVVVEREKVAETPVGMTPWSFKKGGHEPERLPDEKVARTKREILKEREEERQARENEWMESQLQQIDERVRRYTERLQMWADGRGFETWKEFDKKVFMGLKGSLEEIIEANRSGTALDDMEYRAIREKREQERAKARQERGEAMLAAEVALGGEAATDSGRSAEGR